MSIVVLCACNLVCWLPWWILNRPYVRLVIDRISANTTMQKLPVTVIELADDPEIVDSMIEFFYCANYGRANFYHKIYNSQEVAGVDPLYGSIRTFPRPRGPFADITPDLVYQTKIYIMAARYNIPALRVLAADNYAKTLNLDANGVSEMFASLMIPQFVESLKLMYDQTPKEDDDLKAKAWKYARQNYKELVMSEAFAVVCEKHSRVALDILKAVATSHPLEGSIRRSAKYAVRMS